MKSLFKNRIYFLILVFSSFKVLFAQTSDKIEWKNDLEIYKTSLEQKHINLYHSVSKEVFEKEWKNIYNNVDTLNDFQIIIKLMRLTRCINDGHTSVSLRNMSIHQFPFEVKLIGNRWYIVKVDNKHKKLLMLPLVAIDDVPIEEVSTKISEVAQFVENEYSQIVRTADYLNIAELLFALNVTKKEDKAVFTFLDASNNRLKITLDALSSENSTDFTHLTLGVPEIQKPSKPSFPYLWFSPIKNTKALYINFEGYPTFQEMQGFGEKLVSYISKNQIKQLIIDMRNNGGGDLYVGVVLAYALNLSDSLDWKNGVFVLTSNKTFSAATSNAALFKQLLNAKIVGEPTGSNPNGYQDMDTFELPGSKLVITYSKRLFKLSDTKNKPLYPSLVIKPTLKDYKNNNDLVLSKLIKMIKNDKN